MKKEDQVVCAKLEGGVQEKGGGGGRAGGKLAVWVDDSVAIRRTRGGLKQDTAERGDSGRTCYLLCQSRRGHDERQRESQEIRWEPSGELRDHGCYLVLFRVKEGRATRPGRRAKKKEAPLFQ